MLRCGAWPDLGQGSHLERCWGRACDPRAHAPASQMCATGERPEMASKVMSTQSQRDPHRLHTGHPGGLLTPWISAPIFKIGATKSTFYSIWEAPMNTCMKCMYRNKIIRIREYLIKRTISIKNPHTYHFFVGCTFYIDAVNLKRWQIKNFEDNNWWVSVPN